MIPYHFHFLPGSEPTHPYYSLLCCRQIWDQYQNLKITIFGDKSDTVLESVQKFLIEQDKWLRHMIQKHSDHDPLWRHISYILSQFDGLLAGYKSVAEKDWV